MSTDRNNIVARTEGVEDDSQLLEQVEAHMRATLMNEACDMMRRTGLPAMTVLRLAATAMGSIYREMADEHLQGICECGWQPDETSELRELCQALMEKTCQRALPDLAAMHVAGSA
ncbi:hypothetical protein [Oryzicola mucosus]|uniref:Uncharacterized protein n=1 Tax=Oryzicola mucosus TaxID=2767425 RepID=A0A8J6U0C7_9HYPH|nr:hypothetical protein [Oryzicola mucosus]MBD0415466.1 hypothetical protein [Oryzicola mucosus]